MEILILALILHFVADFLLQSRGMGRRKSEEFSVLLEHIGIQFGVMALGLSFLLPVDEAFLISVLNAIVHGIIDWNIWKLYKLSVAYRLEKKAKQLIPIWEELSDDEKLKECEYHGESWEYWNDHLFYTTIGLDQLLHTLTLVVLIGGLYGK